MYAQPSMIRISEVLFNPKSDGSDYVELYNSGSQIVSLSDIRLARWKDSHIDKLFFLDSAYRVGVGEYVVITTDAADIASRYTVRFPSRVVEVPSMPVYNNASGTVIVTTADSVVIDRFDYSESMHSPLLRNADGVALERRSFSQPTATATNWYSAASTVGYGTPTYQNSQSQEVLFLEDEITISADIVSPDGDGYQDVLDIAYQLRQPDLSGSITILDAQGRTVRHLLRNAILGTQGVDAWDGTDDSGNRCRRGNYVLLVELYGAKNERQVMKRVITVII